MSVPVGDIDFDFVFQFHRFVLLFLICIAAEDGCISFLTHYREIQPSEEVRSGRTPTAISAAVHGSVFLRVLMVLHTLYPERLSHLVDNLVFAVGHCRRGRQLARLLGFSLAHLLKLRTLAKMLEEEVLLGLGAFLVNDASHLRYLGILRLCSANIASSGLPPLSASVSQGSTASSLSGSAL